jgi:malate dehydrogenase (oxaloacetate-decarboxylating)(NADP+)
MQAVDIEAIDAAMKMAALDTLRGYSQEHYGTIKQYRTTDYISKGNAGGYQVLREPAWNKGILFSELATFINFTNKYRYIIQP